MGKIIKILTIALCVLAVSNARAQSLSANRTVAAANTVKTARHTCSYVVAGGGLTGFATIKSHNANKQDQTVAKPAESESFETKLYPNPFADYVSIRFGKKATAPDPTVTITDATGRTMSAKYTITEYADNFMEITIPATNLKQGRYIIRIKSGDKVLALKAIKI